MGHSIAYFEASEEIISEVQSFLKEWYNDETFIEVKTSGSTGKPTIIQLEKAKMIVSARKTLDFLNIKKGDTALLCLSPSTIAGKMMLVRSIIGDLKLIVGPINSKPLETILDQIDFVAMVPLQLQKTVESNPEKIRSIKSVIIGGGPISSNVSLLLKKNDLNVYHTYGMTETISHVAMRKVGSEEEKAFNALPGINFKVRNNQLVIEYPEIGIIELCTTDQVKLLDEKSFEWIGRTDFIINSGGKKLNPEEIEENISALIGLPYFIFGLPDETFGQKVVLIIESPISLYLSKKSFYSSLQNHSVPKEIFYLPSFIRTESGKINRIETIKLLGEHVLKEIL